MRLCLETNVNMRRGGCVCVGIIYLVAAVAAARCHPGPEQICFADSGCILFPWMFIPEMGVRILLFALDLWTLV